MPKQVRDALGVGPGDELEFEVNEGRAVVNPRPRRSILEFAGIAGGRSTRLPRTAHDLDKLIETAGRKRAQTRLKR